ncbi:hypothetical protein [Paenibacillus taiwanensis]|uniref:hypothetical protein n=1 Tax=Paenibacillus taiwanensis TaxID=401638 RepID=UPI00048C3E02|nr:hypothetical protein [Paenibacillus taiwanensis]
MTDVDKPARKRANPSRVMVCFRLFIVFVVVVSYEKFPPVASPSKIGVDESGVVCVVRMWLSGL